MKSFIDKLGICAAVSLLVLLAALLPTAVFAAETDATAETDAAVTSEAAAATENVLITGEVTKAAETDDGLSVTLDDGKDGIVLMISKLRFVYDLKAKDYAALADVDEGLQITAVLPENAPLALSAPPQTGAVFGLILNSDAGTFKLDVFDEDLLSGDGDLKLNISEDTLIYKDTGEKRVFTADDLKNQELIVFYDTVQTSQPAQTAPSVVLILSAAPDAAPVEEPAEEPSDEDAVAAEATYVGLRAGAEAKGYTVTWVSNNQPITLSKGDVTATVTIGTDAFTYTHLTKDIQPLDSLDKLDLVTQLTGGKTMVSSTFIELLK
jgi:hypothetical protein